VFHVEVSPLVHSPGSLLADRSSGPSALSVCLGLDVTVSPTGNDRNGSFRAVESHDYVACSMLKQDPFLRDTL